MYICCCCCFISLCDFELISIATPGLSVDFKQNVGLSFLLGLSMSWMLVPTVAVVATHVWSAGIVKLPPKRTHFQEKGTHVFIVELMFL